jgi:hypothetical protein
MLRILATPHKHRNGGYTSVFAPLAGKRLLQLRLYAEEFPAGLALARAAGRPALLLSPSGVVVLAVRPDLLQRSPYKGRRSALLRGILPLALALPPVWAIS